MPTYDVVIVGHFAKDRTVYRGKTRSILGGAVYYGGYVLSALGVRAAVVTRLAEHDRSLLEPLEQRGVEIHCSCGGITTGIENTYLDATMDRRSCKPIAVGEPFLQDELPSLRATVVHVAPLIHGEVPEALVPSFRRWGMLSLDAQGFLRVHHGESLRLERNEAFTRLLRMARFLKLDHAEAEVLTGYREQTQALEALAEMGCREIVLTHAEGVTAWTEGASVESAWTAKNLKGRTGRGDTCMAAYLACRAMELSPEQSLPVAAAITSRKLEHEGPYAGTLEEISPQIVGELTRRIPPRTCDP